MAKGRELGDFSHRLTSVTVQPGPAGSTIQQSTWEGGASGYGTIFSTATFVGGKSGTFSFYTAAYLENGDQVSGSANGVYESVGIHVWRTEGVVHVSDGG